MPDTFIDRVVYLDDRNFADWRCEDCGAAPDIIWESADFGGVPQGMKVFVAVDAKCPNGTHQITPEQFRQFQREYREAQAVKVSKYETQVDDRFPYWLKNKRS
jgi:hypothetical protein